ncbi:fatty acyl-AMP ligase [Reyranella sp.]|uniref:fatty acyl-AMP ligase n=1 Tax=Reyranella sp. TaxID=1929291 RepID=UPI00262C9A17|nr:fatty acyl-AMP ligase [Reyranella sp.]HQT11415.1 fatty acyl-AMP ligase [Reyranella sp.]
MTSIRGILPALLSNATPAEGPAGRMQRYVSTLHSSPERWVTVPTPTHNVSLPFRRGGFASLVEALDYAARGETGFNFFDARGKLLTRLPYSHLRTEALSFARRLIGAGIEPGERLILIADTWPGFCIAFFGCQYAGIVPVPVPVPVGLGAKAHYIFQLRKQITAAQAVGVLAPDELIEFARSAAEGTTARFAGGMEVFSALPEANVDLRALGAGMACYVQFSSGSTRAPLGVDIRQDQLMANIDGSITAQGLDEDDSGVSWLPLYHDMGLIGFILAPMCAQRSVDLLAPRDFARRPMQWLSLISRRRATITYSPSFGYDLLTRRAQTAPMGELDLSSLRLAGVGADMIQLPVLRRFAEAFQAAGFDERAFMPSYGMAEVCVGLSFAAPFGGVKPDSFTDPQSGRTREFVVCGRVMAGHSVEIRDESGAPLGERHVGRLFVRGPSVMPGYFQKPDESAHVLSDGWLDTGDLGYWHKGELVITGRAKDLIIVNGRNIWPQDIEWAVEALPQVGRGDACAFSIEDGDTETVVVIVQAYPSEPAEREALVGDIKQAVKEAAGVDGRVVLIKRQPGLPRTSSGKLSRTHAKSKFAAGDYPT